MMSDEEKQGDVYIRHPPSYRSSTLTKFIEKLDSRSEGKNSKSHPRVKRQLGTSVDVPVPRKAKKWMLRSELRNTHATAEGDISQQNIQESDVEHASMDESDTEANKNALESELEPTSSDESD